MKKYITLVILNLNWWQTKNWWFTIFTRT